MYPKTIQKLIDLFSEFPTVGPRTAARFVFYLLGKNEKEIEDLNNAIFELKKRVKVCHFCFNPFEPTGIAQEKLCSICSKPSRDKTLFCIIEKGTDLETIEKIKKYQGLYFILGGTVSSLKKEKIKELRFEELKERIEKPGKFGIFDADFKEIIIATNSTTEGEATALYLVKVLKPFNKKISRLGKGLPVGSELEYADEETLSSALENRR